MGNKVRPIPKPQPLPLHLRAWRKHRGYSQAQLAERIGTTIATISRIETQKQNWDQEFLQIAADVLSCSPADLMVRDPTGPDPMWSVYDRLKPPERAQVVRIVRALADTGTDD